MACGRGGEPGGARNRRRGLLVASTPARTGVVARARPRVWSWGHASATSLRGAGRGRILAGGVWQYAQPPSGGTWTAGTGGHGHGRDRTPRKPRGKAVRTQTKRHQRRVPLVGDSGGLESERVYVWTEFVWVGAKSRLESAIGADPRATASVKEERWHGFWSRPTMSARCCLTRKRFARCTLTTSTRRCSCLSEWNGLFVTRTGGCARELHQRAGWDGINRGSGARSTRGRPTVGRTGSPPRSSRPRRRGSLIGHLALSKMARQPGLA
jgi:hypothetical protein